jgi:hypothetical protein
MRHMRWKVHLAALSLGVTAAFAPIEVTGEIGITTANAECTSCCKEMESLCIKCAEECVKVNNAYDQGGGRCSVSPIAPEIPG